MEKTQTSEQIARRAAEQIIRNCGDLRVLTIGQFVERVSPVIRDAIHKGVEAEMKRAEEARVRADALT
jgi:hypothetical protein